MILKKNIKENLPVYIAASALPIFFITLGLLELKLIKNPCFLMIMLIPIIISISMLIYHIIKNRPKIT